MRENIITVDGLRKSYGSQQVVDNISFEVQQGEIFGLLGSNGAGKTTTLEILETLRKKDSGKVIIDNVDLDQNPGYIKRMIGIQLQNGGYYPGLKLKELIKYYAAIYNVKPNVDDMLKSMNLLAKANDKYANLSGGQKQSLSLLIAIINDPKIIFLDEPTTGLDPHARKNLWMIIKRLKEEGKTILITTHYMEEAQELCDRVAIMKRGKLIAMDSPLNMIKTLTQSGFKSQQQFLDASMEDVFIKLTGEQIEA